MPYDARSKRLVEIAIAKEFEDIYDLVLSATAKSMPISSRLGDHPPEAIQSRIHKCTKMTDVVLDKGAFVETKTSEGYTVLQEALKA